MKTIIDISSHTTINDYDSLKQFDGVYIKATEGATFTSPSLETQVQECIKRQIPYGLYHFAGKTHTAKEEYNFFKSVSNKYQSEFKLLPDCLDYENSEENIQFINDFMVLDSALIFYSYRAIVYKTSLPKNKIWVAIPSTYEPALNDYLGIQYQLDVKPVNSNLSNYDISVFNDSVFTTPTMDLKESIKMRAIKQGEFSQRVRAIQAMLNVLIGSQLKIDGNFGDNTLNAVRQYQASRGLTVDGVVGINTTNSLINDIDNLIKE
jgi:lysozyme